MTDRLGPDAVTVCSVDGSKVTLTNAPLNCAACADGTGCGAALLTARRDTTTIEWSDGPRPQPGDQLVPIRSHAVLRAAALGYGLPLTGFVIGASVGHSVGADAAAVLGGVCGVILGALAGRYLAAVSPVQWHICASDTS